MLQRLRQQLLSGIRDCLPIVISQRLRQTVVNKQLLPEAATLAYGGKLLLNPRAQMAGIAGQLAEMQGRIDSSFSRSRRARTGDVPPEETATISGERSMIDGMIKLAWRGASTTLQKIRRASAASLTCWLTVSSSVAAMASQQLSSSEG